MNQTPDTVSEGYKATAPTLPSRSLGALSPRLDALSVKPGTLPIGLRRLSRSLGMLPFGLNTLSLSLGALLLGGCVHTSPEPAPLQNIQVQWEDAALLPSPEFTERNARWWESFNDPVLTELIELAEQNNLDLRLAALRVQEARAINSAAEAGLWPELTGALGAGRSRGATTGTRNTFSAGVEASWEVDITGRLAALARSAEAGLLTTEADAQAVRLALLAEVANAYVQYRVQYLLLAITQESVRLQEATQAITEQRYEAGMASQLDVQRGLSVLAHTRSQGAEAVQAADAARFTLAYLLATTPAQLAERIGTGITLPHADAISVLLSPIEVLEQRPDIHAALARYAATTAQHDAAVADRLPRLTLAGLIGLENDKLSDIFEGRQLIWTAAGNLAAPLLDFGRRAAAADAADARRQQAEVIYEQTVRNALRETQTAIVAYVQGVIRHRELSIALEAATRAAQVATLQYEEGVLSQLEVIDAEKTLHEARRRWAVSGALVAASLIDLYRVMGISPEAPAQDADAS